jgi:hypothetical protein
VAGNFLQIAVVPAQSGAASRCNSSALRAIVQIAGLAGAGNLIWPGRELSLPGQGIRVWWGIPLCVCGSA